MTHEVKVGQIYSFHPDPQEPAIIFTSYEKIARVAACDIAFEISEIEQGAVLLKCIKDNPGRFELGSEYVAAVSDIMHDGPDKSTYRLIWERESGVSAQYGVYCGKCGQFYPYAERKNDFRCWACRNGF